MVRIYTYNDLQGYSKKLQNVKSNLCTWYYTDRNKFCGNYSSRKINRFNRRCWRHKRRGEYSSSLPPIILLMISASERTYNRELWIKFLKISEEKGVPFELVIYHEDMINCTVRQPHNLLSRFRPFPDIFGKTLPLRGRHGGINFAQICFKMLEYGCKIPHAGRCIILTERAIPIRSPVTIYKTALASKCYIDIQYNVRFGPEPQSLPRFNRNKPFAGVNNLCHGLYTTEFLKAALPTVRTHCEFFGISLNNNNNVYTITNENLYEQWRRFTGANLDEFWLLNSFLLGVNGSRGIQKLKGYMEKTVANDVYTVAEIAQWRDNWKRTYVFRDPYKREPIPRFDNRVERYYRGLDLRRGVSLRQVIRFLRRNKSHAVFFRQVELP